MILGFYCSETFDGVVSIFVGFVTAREFPCSHLDRTRFSAVESEAEAPTSSVSVSLLTFYPNAFYNEHKTDQLDRLLRYELPIETPLVEH